jgi:hypothetical protein
MPTITATHKRFARFLAAAKTYRRPVFRNSISIQSLKETTLNWHAVCKDTGAQINGDQRSMRAQ